MSGARGLTLNQLVRRITLLLSAVIALAAATGGLAVYGAWQVHQLLEEAAARYLPSVLAADELQLALLEQRGLLSSFLLDNGNPQWTERLTRRKAEFQNKLAAAQATVRTEEGAHILGRLRGVYAEYDSLREQVLALYEQGQVEQAARLVTRDLYATYDRAHELCAALTDVRKAALKGAADDARRRTATMTTIVTAALVLSIALWAMLLLLMIRRVWRPLKEIAADAAQYGARPVHGGEQVDEMRAVGAYLRTLVSDVAEARSDLQRSRSQLLGAEKLATVGKLAASVAHEIRNPLTAMKMWLFSVSRSLGERPDVQAKLDVISGEIDRLESIVRNFLEFSRPPALNARQVDVNALISRTVELVRGHASEQSVRIETDVAADVPPLEADPDQLRQVLINLIDNAVAVLPPDGEIRISATRAATDSGRPAALIRVQDSGPGIPLDVQSRIFEPFFTTKEQGTGLGLCIAAQIIAAHGGKLTLESSNSHGTTFALLLEGVRAA